MDAVRHICSGASEAWRLVFRPARRRGALPAYLAVPDRLAADAPPIVAVHGLARNAREQANLLAPAAAASGQIVIAPHFCSEGWKRFQKLVQKRRADLALIALLGELRSQFPGLPSRVVLSGFSGGAQFAHRFALLHPHHVERLVITAAGWYTFPADDPYPYGLGAAEGANPGWGPTFAGNLGTFLRLPIAVCVGAFDNASDATLQRSASIDRVQGIGRKTRAQRWVVAMRAAAQARGIEPRMTLHILDGCAHDFAICVRIGGLDRHIVVAPDGAPT